MNPLHSKFTAIVLVFVLGSLFVPASHADLLPVTGFTGGLTGNDEITAVEVDASGNYYIAGVNDTRIDLGGPAPLSPHGSFVAKYSPTGTLLWETQLSGNCRVNDIDVKSGWVAAVGWAVGAQVTIDGTAYTTTGGAMLMRLTAGAGSVNWFTSHGSIAAVRATGVELLGNNWALVCGEFSGTSDLGTGNATSNGLTDFYFQHINTSGVVQTVVTTGSAGVETGGRLALDSSGSILFSGSFFDTIVFGAASLVSKGDADICVVKFSNLSSITWATSFGGSDEEIAGSVDTDINDNVYLTGSFENTADFGGGNVASTGGFDGYVVSLKNTGIFNWADRFGGGANDFSFDIDHRDGRLALVGELGDGGDFGAFTIPSGGNTNDAFLAEIDLSGNWSCAESGGGAGADRGLQTVIDPSGAVMMGGYHTGDAVFGSITLDNVPFATGHQAFWVIYSGSVGIGDFPSPGGAGLTLGVARPNPFRLQTRLSFETVGDRRIESARVFNAAGRLVRDLSPGRVASGTLHWDGRDQFGRRVESGVYFFRVTDSIGQQNRRVTVIR